MPLKSLVPDFVVALMTPPDGIAELGGVRGSLHGGFLHCLRSKADYRARDANPGVVHAIGEYRGAAVATTVDVQVETRNRLIRSDVPVSSLPASPDTFGAVTAIFSTLRLFKGRY